MSKFVTTFNGKDTIAQMVVRDGAKHQVYTGIAKIAQIGMLAPPALAFVGVIAMPAAPLAVAIALSASYFATSITLAASTRTMIQTETGNKPLDPSNQDAGFIARLKQSLNPFKIPKM